MTKRIIEKSDALRLKAVGENYGDVMERASAEVNHMLLQKLRFYQAPALLPIDEIGYLPLGDNGSNLFFQVITARHGKKSTMITTNRVFADWGEVFDNSVVATAIADRLVANSVPIILEGESCRKRLGSKNRK